MRLAAVLSLLPLAACTAETPPGDRISCGPEGGELTEFCTMQQVGEQVTVRRPDGSFRRLIRPDLGFTTAADGAECVDEYAVSDGSIVTIGGWTYHLKRR